MKFTAPRLFASLCIVFSFASPVRADDLPAPYHDVQNNLIYNVLFCDSEPLYKPKDATSAVSWQKTLFIDTPDTGAVRTLAEDGKEPSCVRLLAYRWLRQHSQLVPAKQLLGVVIEVPTDKGLDTLAAYADGHVRYISQAEKVALIDVPPADMQEKTKAWLASSNKVVARIGPWLKKRLPAPIVGKVRLTFLASDGLYFGEGSFAAIQKDADTAQVVKDATVLLKSVVDLSAKSAAATGH